MSKDSKEPGIDFDPPEVFQEELNDEIDSQNAEAEPEQLREKLIEALTPVLIKYEEESDSEYLGRAAQVLEYFANSDTEGKDPDDGPTSDRYD